VPLPTNPVTPRIPIALLRRLLPHAEQDEVIDDLEHEFQQRAARDGAGSARRWVWRQALQSLPALMRRTWWRGRTGFEPRANAFQPGGPSVEHWIMDARYAARRLLSRPLYAGIAILTLALGVGGTAASFGVARAVLLSPLPYTDPAGVGLFWMPLDWNQSEFAHLRGRTPGFSEIAQFRPSALTLEQGDGPARLVPGIFASHELFSVLGTKPFMGRAFEPADDVQGAATVAVISYGLWLDLGEKPDIIGSLIRLDGQTYSVIGVMPRGFWFPSPAERVWVPQPLVADERVGNFTLVGRVAPGQSPKDMTGPIAGISQLLRERFTYNPQWDKLKTPSIQSAEEASIRPLRPAILATLVAMAMILLIACANVAALMLGQVEGRAVELAVRSALGADRKRLTGQLIAEALILGLTAGAAGAAVAVGAFKLLVSALPLGAWSESAALDWRVFLVAMGIAVGSALAISLVPVLSLWRGRLRGAISSGRTTGVIGRQVRLESVLVVCEVAVAVLMAAGAGVLTRSVAKLYAIDPGIRPAGVGVIELSLPSDLSDPDRKRLVGELTERVRAIPGIASAGMVQWLPLRGSAWNFGLQVQGKPDLPSTTTLMRIVTPGYFEAMGITLSGGRGFAETDLAGGIDRPVAVINEALAKKFFEGEDPLGRWVSTGATNRGAIVVGIAPDVAEGALTDPRGPVRYLPYTAFPFTSQSLNLVFRMANDRDPLPMLTSVRRAINETSPRVAIAQASTMEHQVALAIGPVRQIMSLVSLLTGLALLLGAIGIYGVMSHFVSRRKRDWGIRIALGQRPNHVISTVVRHGSALVGIGIGIGLVSFLAVGRLLRPLIYGIGAADPASISAAALALLLVGVFAAWLPAARASRTDPAIVLREQ
jgi:predicted permease